MDRRTLAFPLLIVVASLLFFCRLHAPLLEPEEARYAEIPRQMLAADRWVVPVMNGQDYLDKPPLHYWLVMASYRLFGVHDWSARRVEGLICVLTVAVVYGWARRIHGVRAAFAAGLVLCLTPEFIYRGRMVGPNGLLALFTTAALAAGNFARLSCPIRWGWWIASGMATGLGTLTKGPVALALVMPPLVIAPLFDRRLARVGVLNWLTFLAVASAVAAPWYFAVAWRCPEFVGYFLWFHNVVRFAAPFDHAKPFWFYLPQLGLGLLPWPLLLIPRIRERIPALASFAFLAATWGVLFFSLAGSKRPAYLLPVLPPLALAIGCYLRNWSARRWLALGGSMFVVLWIATLAVWPSYADRFSLKGLVAVPPVTDRGRSVYCYPQPWEAVSFYLRRDDVLVVRSGELHRLVTELDRQPEAVIFVKTACLPDVLAALPPDVHFDPADDRLGVTVGRVRRSREGSMADGTR
jgi:4-amino-4-deoxy-L-arabinose transferase-like glycosyltransferase